MVPDSSTKLCCLLGDPIEHSISPYIHNQSFQVHDLNYLYLAFRVRRVGLKDAIGGLRELNFVGGNLTMPLKEEVVPLLDELDPSAKKVGACNTMLNSNGKLIGFNTDVEGFARPLRKRIGSSFSGLRAVLVGAGGAARAAAVALAEGGCGELLILNRTVANGKRVAALIGKNYSTVVRVGALTQVEVDKVVDHDLIINAAPLDFRSTSIGFVPNRNQSMIAYDMVYSQGEESFFLREMNKTGATMITGKEMLVEQAAISFEIWTGIKPNLSRLSNDADTALGGTSNLD